MKAKKVGSLLMLLGAALLSAALLLLVYNVVENKRANEAAQSALPAVQETIASRSQAATADSGHEPMMAVTVAGNGYIGVLSLPQLGLELPVLSEWSYPNLDIGPCRHFGATETNDLVIAGHDYSMHFGGLPNLTIGAPVRFTDMNGGVYYYKVGTMEVIPGDAGDYVKNSGWDLVLYTCTYSGRERVMVGANRVTAEEYSRL